ncbi:efflux RND transporter periplasmic adaptor subunit [Tardiphaga sp. vice304]|uniref:efflux RND transporter periplasmic adaptor subunit n=1 Tax=Tardiphaga sp. vice304 TaxID=2592817 RepID=UPI0011626AD6|nr:efflux RND transporter periplasmic adaptor subunit [Tardiphaga sp. vice304]
MNFKQRFPSLGKKRLAVGGAAALVVLIGIVALTRSGEAPRSNSEVSSQSRKNPTRYVTTPAEWASLTVEPVSARAFRAEHVTEGKIAVDEDKSTPVFSPYAGRVTKLLARPGDSVRAGQPLFTIEAADNVGAQNDFITAITSLNKAKSQLDLATIQDKRAKDLSEGRAIPLKDYQKTQATLLQAQNDQRSAETALEAARNRLRFLGFTNEAIAAFQDQGKINPETTIYAPIAGVVVARKIGPGQFVSAGATDPAYVIGDLSTVWLTAFVRETEASEVELGQELTFNVLALPGRVLTGKINYVATALDPATRRLMVRATLDNAAGLLKPEMFATVTIYAPGDQPTVGVPRQALIYEGDQVRVWVAHDDDKTIELRVIKTGLVNGNLVEVSGNLRPGERIVTRGSLFIDRAASSS